MQHAVLALQEVHGTTQQQEIFMHEFTPSHHVQCSGHSNPHAGGVALLIARTLPTPSFRELVPGRALAAEVADSAGVLSIFLTIHNFDLTAEHRSSLQEYIASARVRAGNSGQGKGAVWILGDFNFLPRYEVTTKFSPETGMQQVERKKDRQLWDRILNGTTELQQPEDTRAAWRAHGDEKGYISARLDRCYTTLPGWALIQTDIQGKTVCQVLQARERVGSDHVPVTFVVQSKQPRRTRDKPIPLWIARHPMFERILPEYLAAADLERRHIVDRWLLTKRIMRQVSKVVAKASLSAKASTTEQKAQVVLQAARAAWHLTHRRFASLVHTLPELARFAVEGIHGEYELIDTEGFSEFAAGIMRTKVQDDIEREQESINAVTARADRPPPRAMERSLSRFRRWAKLWQACDRRLQLQGVIAGSAVLHSPQEQARELGKFWGEVFSASPIDEELAGALSRTFTARVEWAMEHFPSSAGFQAFLRRAPHSACGPDGIPYSAWRAAGDSGVQTLLKLGWHIMSSGSPPPAFNESLSVFIPKPVEDTPGHEGCRAPEDTRPLSLKNCDNKAVAAVLNQALSAVTPTWAHRDQRGFVPGRQGIDNIIELDAAMRVVDWSVDPSLPPSAFPASVCFDFAAAFPSLAHRFLFLILKALGVPPGLMRALQAMYRQNEAFISVGGQLFWLFSIRQGVLQGCPLSGSLFVFCVNVMLLLLQNSMHPQSSLKAFADDIAIVIRRLSELRQVHASFAVFARASNLRLKPRKCAIIPLGAPFTSARAVEIRAALAALVPDWGTFAIESAAKYLGVWVGLSVRDRVWEAAVEKWEHRTLDLAAAEVAPSLACRQYNCRAVPVLGYVAQLCPLPKQVLVKERRLHHKLFHFVAQGFPPHLVVNLKRVGFPAPISVDAVARAAAFRAANKTSTTWRAAKASLDETRVSNPLLCSIPGGEGAERRAVNPWWDTNPIVDFLEQAAQAFPLNFGATSALEVCFASPAGEQRPATIAFLPLVAPFNWVCELSRRLLLWCELASPGFARILSGVEWDPVLDSLRRAHPSAVMAAIRTWCNAWSTACRCHDARASWVCKLCGRTDSLPHMIFECDKLWRQVTRVLGQPIGHTALSRLALCSPFIRPPRGADRSRLLYRQPLFRLQVVCSAYHALPCTTVPHGAEQIQRALEACALKAAMVH